MLHLTIIIPEMYDEVNEEFIPEKRRDLQLEHSLVSISKWESKWCKPFLSDTPLSREETIDYVRCMTMTQNVDPELYNYISDDMIERVDDYISAKMTATWFAEDKKSKRRGGNNGEAITSEVIYWWMISQNIPLKCEKWHLNRLLTLIRVCNIKNSPGKKMSMKDILSQQSALNAARRKSFNTKR